EPGEFEDDLDHLSELNAALESIDDEMDAQVTAHRGRYDLCPECYRQFLRNPLGREMVMELGFSNN
ncbi:MAG: hypothetical protein AAGA03_17725, partial [Planctomycetota bacterium]